MGYNNSICIYLDLFEETIRSGFEGQSEGKRDSVNQTEIDTKRETGRQDQERERRKLCVCV